MKKQESKLEQSISSINKNRMIAMGVIAVLIIVGIVYLSMGSKITLPLVKTTPDVKTSINNSVNPEIVKEQKIIVLQSSKEIDKYDARRQSITGKVKNNATTLVHSILITAYLYDDKGKFLKTEVTRPVINDLEPGQTSLFTMTDIFEQFYSYKLEVSWN